MRASRIFDNGSGDKFEVSCEYYNSVGTPTRWKIWVCKKPKGKRKFVYLGPTEEEIGKVKGLSFHDREKYRMREIIKIIPWTWIEMVMDDVCAEIRKLGNELYPKDEEIE